MQFLANRNYVGFMNKEGTKGKWYYFDLSCERRDAIPDLTGIVYEHGT